MLAVPDFDSHDLSSISAVIIGGGPATPALVREARARIAAPLAVRYSCTEAAIGVGTAFDDPEEDAEITVGRPQRGIELAILDDDDRPVEPGAVGNVCLRSAAVMSEYYRDPETTAAVFTADGFVRTGDLGWVDDRGRLRLSGRAKEMYVRGGYNVYPAEVEAVLAEHTAVAAISVVARQDHVMGEVGVAFVVARQGHTAPTLTELRDFGRGWLAGYKLPDEVRVVDALPLTAMDKVDRRALAAQAEQP
jgi:acyl-CoA synthetase (AMP-forming)/AMP-acid ligase II